MNAVFADAFYFVARLNRHDQHHERTLAFSRDFRAHLLTTDWVLMEVADALAESESRARIREFIVLLRQSPACEVVAASRDLLDRALGLFTRGQTGDWNSSWAHGSRALAVLRKRVTHSMDRKFAFWS
jgi:uncharacterized protein